MKQLVVQTYSPDQLTDVTRNFSGASAVYTAMAIPLEYCMQPWKVDVFQYHIDLTVSSVGTCFLGIDASLYRQVAPISQAGASDVVLELVCPSVGVAFVFGAGSGTFNTATIYSSNNLDLIGGEYYVVFSTQYQPDDAGDVARATWKGVIDADANILYPKYDITFPNSPADYLNHPATIAKSALTRNTTDWPWVACVWG